MKLKGNQNFLSNEKHIAATGTTGAGKSTLINELHYETNRISIVFNPLKLDIWAGFYTDTTQGVKQYLQEGKTRIVLNTHYDETKAKEQAHEVLSYVYTLHEINQNLKFQLVWDECHNFGRNGQHSAPIVRAVKEGRNKNIKNIMTTQEPQKVNNSVYSQSYLIWIGGVPGWGRDYLQGKHINVEKVEDQQDYHFTVFNENGEYMAKGVTDPSYSG